jgi:hypothetical protein
MEYLRATIDDEMGKIGPSPSGCGANRAILHSRIRQWATTAVVLGFGWPDFRSQRYPRESE